MTEQANLSAVADWHADKAEAAYRSGELDDYSRHIRICDELRRHAWLRLHSRAA